MSQGPNGTIGQTYNTVNGSSQVLNMVQNANGYQQSGHNVNYGQGQTLNMSQMPGGPMFMQQANGQYQTGNVFTSGMNMGTAFGSGQNINNVQYQQSAVMHSPFSPFSR